MKANPWLRALPVLAGVAIIAGIVLLGTPGQLFFGLLLTLVGFIAAIGWIVASAITWNQNHRPRNEEQALPGSPTEEPERA